MRASPSGRRLSIACRVREGQTRHARVAAANLGIKRDHGHAGAPLTLVDVHVATPEGMPLLERANFTAEAGTSLLLIGPSGCGKTTLLRAVCGAAAAIVSIGHRSTHASLHHRTVDLSHGSRSPSRQTIAA